MDTIFALSTAVGKAGVAVIRISGTLAISALARLNGDIPKPRMAALRVLTAADGTRLDEALVLVFEEKQSFTGEETVEIQCHGSPAVVAAILSELSAIDGLRNAEAGEFTHRALENNRLDIAQVEGLADLLEADTEAQRRQALRVFSGQLGEKAEEWRRDLIRAAALIEATIDFADEEVPVDVSPEVTLLIDRTMESLSAEVKGVDMAERIRAGFEVAIVGAPNVGKSTLLNALARREAAITSEVAGTTRDIIEVQVDLSGLPVTFLDTAGLRETDDVVESIGIDRAVERAQMADLRVFLTDGDAELLLSPSPGDIVLQAKADLGAKLGVGISGKTGAGVAELVDRVGAVLTERSAYVGVATRLRHKISMQRALFDLSESQRFMSAGESHADLAAEALRSAIRALDSLVGRIDVENVLDEIFASFCLGK